MAPPIVLIHGFATSSARTWGETGWLDILGDSDRDIQPIDIPGHGTAANMRETQGYDSLEADVLAQFPEEPVDAVGFSMGAKLLLTIASAHPERFNRLVLAGIGENLFRYDEDRHAAILAAVDGKLDPEDPAARFFYDLAQAPDVDQESLVAMMKSPRPRLDEQIISKVSCPVLVVIGDKDFAGPADRLVEALPNAKHQVLRNVDHFATPKNFGFIDATIEFLDVFGS